MNAQRGKRVALVTGAANRIGRRIAEQLHAADWRVIIHYHSSHEQALALADALNAQRPDSARLLRANLHSSDEVQELATAGLACWGGIDALINNASGFFPTDLNSSAEELQQDWDSLMNSNLRAAFFLCHALREALSRNHGSIVNISDIHAERPLQAYSIYSIAKAGLAMLTRSLALELAPEVRVNGIAPGAILWPDETGQGFAAGDKDRTLAKIPLGRMGDPDDIAATVAFLLSGSDYITGQIIAVDGGRLLTG